MTRSNSRLRRGSTRSTFLIVIALFVLAWIGTAIFGYRVYLNVLDTARETDTAMRSLAWAALVYTCREDGRFPTDAQQLFAMQPLPDSIDCVPSEAGDWPTTRQELLGDLVFPDDLKHASRKMKLYFSSDGIRPPVIDANGLPTELGTTEEIPLWFESMKSSLQGTDS
ncbi:MAG: hypothetical protein CMJ33_06735 [Phycisphaerae bacterium]|nr:hypothetical protein [Phycisphaerae bacterium]HAW94849.1 hypothetical protein [Phycisphaerales bacterium]